MIASAIDFRTPISWGYTPMSFGEAVSAGFQRYFDFDGRSGRPDFWWFWLFIVLVGIGSLFMDWSLGFGPEQVGPANGLWTLASIIPLMSAGARRLHDIGRSGWWQLIGFVPIIGALLLIYWWCQPTASA